MQYVNFFEKNGALIRIVTVCDSINPKLSKNELMLQFCVASQDVYNFCGKALLHTF